MRLKRLPIILCILTGVSILISCNTETTVKPSAYPRIHFPQRGRIVEYNDPGCPYTFQLPDYYVVQKKTKYFDDTITNDCWLNIECSDLNATIYLSYKKLAPEQTLKRMVEETYELTFKHTQKADYIEPQEIDNGHNAQGLIYYVGGDAASNIQFFLTDTAKNFVRGALYFYAKPNTDSLKPVVQFMIEDVKGILASWRWKE